MRNYRVFTFISCFIWILTVADETITAKTLTVALVFYLAMAVWSAFTIIEEENK